MYFTVTTNVAYFMYKTGVMEKMVFIDPMKLAWKDIKSRKNRSQTVNILVIKFPFTYTMYTHKSVDA